MRRPSFEEIVDGCIEDVTAGRMGVAECLDRWPEYQDELAPILEAVAAMRRVPPVPERAPTPARRQALMIAIGQLPQEQPRRFPWLRLPSLRMAPFMRLAMAAAPAAAVIVIAFALFMSQPAAPASATTLTLFAGQAEVHRDGRWHSAADGERMTVGTAIRTGPGGYALLTFQDGSTVALMPDTQVVLQQADFEAGALRSVVLRQDSGRLWNDVVSNLGPGARYVVHTPDARIEALATTFETAIENGQTSVVAAQGFVRLVAGGREIPVARGELARTSGGTIVEHRAAAALDEAIVVHAPFAATLISPRGEASGVRPDGVLLRQVRGVTTAAPARGLLRFDLHTPEPGLYTLLLERFDEGDGDLVLRTDEGVRTVALSAVGVARLQLEVTAEHGVPRLRLVDDQLMETDLAAFPLRVVETRRTREAVPLVERPAGQPGERPETSGSPSPEATRPPQPPDFVLAIEAERAGFRQRLLDALASGDRAVLTAVLNEAVDDDDPAILRARMGVLAQFLDDPRLGERLREILAPPAPESEPQLQPHGDRRPAGPPPGLRDRLERALQDAGPPASLDQLDRLLPPRGQPGPPPGQGRPAPSSADAPSEGRGEQALEQSASPEATPAPTRTPAPRSTPAPTPTRAPEPEPGGLLDDLLGDRDANEPSLLDLLAR